MRNFVGDLRVAARQLRRAPSFTLIAAGALALGIGANAAVFSVVDALLIRPLPFHDPARLAVVWERNLPRDVATNVVSPGNYLQWRELNHSFVDLAVASPAYKTTLSGDGDAIELPVQYVSSTLLGLLGVRPQLGRGFAPGDDFQHVVLISDGLWRRRFGADPSIINRLVTLDGQRQQVVGVMPPHFAILEDHIDVWATVGFPASARIPRGRWIQVIGRLKPGVTMAAAQEDMTRVHAELTRRYPEFDTGWTANVVPLPQQMTAKVRPALLLMLGAVALVLLIACANVGNLVLVRATGRTREMAVRTALGAGRWRLARQLLAESVLLSVLGGAAGLLLASWALAMLHRAAADTLSIAGLSTVDLNTHVLLFALAAATVSAVLFSIAPALSTGMTRPLDALKQGGRAGQSKRTARMRGVLVVAEVALALVLLAGAGLLVRSFASLLAIDPGFEPDHTLTMRVSIPSTRYKTPAVMVTFFDRLFERIDALPGVTAAGGTSFLPLTGAGAATDFTVVGKPQPAAGQAPVCDVRVVTHAYFKATGIPLLRGRLFNSGDRGEHVHRVIIDRALADQYFPGENPIGHQLIVSWNDSVPDEIVGVVGSVRQQTLEREARPVVYWPPSRFAYPFMTVAIRTSSDPGTVANAAVAALHGIDPNVAAAEVRTLAQVVDRSVAERRLTMTLLTAFAAMSLLLASIGIYGVISFSVSQRTQEIGVRMALGAPRALILRMVAGQAAVLAGAGILAGGALAWGTTRLMRTMLFEVTPSDPLTFAAVAGVLAVAALAAALVPALRATRVDPAIALRAQ